MVSDRFCKCLELRKIFFPYALIGNGVLECISYPFPNDRGGISVMVRRTGHPFAIRRLEIISKDGTEIVVRKVRSE